MRACIDRRNEMTAKSLVAGCHIFVRVLAGRCNFNSGNSWAGSIFFHTYHAKWRHCQSRSVRSRRNDETNFLTIERFNKIFVICPRFGVRVQSIFGESCWVIPLLHLSQTSYQASCTMFTFVAVNQHGIVARIEESRECWNDSFIRNIDDGGFVAGNSILKESDQTYGETVSEKRIMMNQRTVSLVPPRISDSQQRNLLQQEFYEIEGKSVNHPAVTQYARSDLQDTLQLEPFQEFEIILIGKSRSI